MYAIVCLFEVDKKNMYIFVELPSFLEQLSEEKYLIYCRPSWSESSLIVTYSFFCFTL